MSDVAAVTRLITCTDVHDWPGQPAGQVSVSAVLKAELADGRQVVLLDDRGWSASLRVEGRGVPPDQWGSMTRQEIEETARTVVGPDEPLRGQRAEDAERMHWTFLAGVLEEQGVMAAPGELRALPHEVVLSDRLSARVAGAADPP